jgi:quercetin dioxygenase-like cupin family protein
MRKMNWKLVLAAVFAACAIGGFAAGLAWATPARGTTVTTLAGPAALDALNIKAEFESHELEIKTKGVWETRVVHHLVVPGGETGWHSHPGPVFVMVTAGTLTKYDWDDDGITRRVYPAGTGFVEYPGVVHIGTNQGTVNLEMVSFLLTPQGAPTKIDEPDPRD